MNNYRFPDNIFSTSLTSSICIFHPQLNETGRKLLFRDKKLKVKAISLFDFWCILCWGFGSKCAVANITLMASFSTSSAEKLRKPYVDWKKINSTQTKNTYLSSHLSGKGADTCNIARNIACNRLSVEWTHDATLRATSRRYWWRGYQTNVNLNDEAKSCCCYIVFLLLAE